MQTSPREPYLSEVLTVISFMVIFVLLADFYFNISMHIPLILSVVVTVFMGLRLGYKWTELETMMLKGLQTMGRLNYFFILLGILIGTWMISGTVPALIFYGIKILNPRYFLLTAFLILSVVSMAMGSSIGSTGTAGVALMAIGQGLGIPLPLVAGAIVSGAYFGDRCSPLSSTVNVTADSTNSSLPLMVKDFLLSIIPAYLLACAVYLVLGLHYGNADSDLNQVNQITSALLQTFHLSPFLLIPPALLIFLAFRRVPILINVFFNIVLSVFVALTFQGQSLSTILQTMYHGLHVNTGVTQVDALLNRGGLTSMFELIILFIIIAALAGLLENTGMMNVVLNKLLPLVKNTGSLILTTVITCFFLAALTCNQIMAIVLTGRMFSSAYAEKKISATNLARAIADSGLIMAPLIPWNINALMMAALLGVSTFAYSPYAFLCWIAPLVSIFYGYSGLAVYNTKNKIAPIKTTP